MIGPPSATGDIWRLGASVLRLRYAPRRVDCPACCGVVTEKVPWARHGSRFTRDFEELVAYLARSLDKTAVSERVPDERLSGLEVIGTDEFSYPKRHR